MYLRTTQRRNKDGSVVRYHALAENVRHPEKGYVEAKVVHSFGRAVERGIGLGTKVLVAEPGGQAAAILGALGEAIFVVHKKAGFRARS